MSDQVKEIVKKFLPTLSLSEYGQVYTDTTEYMKISYGDIIKLKGQHYLVLRDEAERSFGVEDPKYWVKRCIHLESGKRKILKLVFYEKFLLKLGDLKIPCYRSPKKEARILELVKGDSRFMQGESVHDEKGNIVRVIDVISGKRLDHKVFELPKGHKEYFFTDFPKILKKFIEACLAIKFLHDNGEIHGDIRRDHLWIQYKKEPYVWIDFDYTYDFEESPFGLDIFGLGSLLTFLAGKQIYTTTNIDHYFPDNNITIEQGDLSLLYKNRIVNLKKLFPYIPDSLNFVLLHFCQESEVFYDTVDEFLEDVNKALDDIIKG